MWSEQCLIKGTAKFQTSWTIRNVVTKIGDLWGQKVLKIVYMYVSHDFRQCQLAHIFLKTVCDISYNTIYGEGPS